ncbi:hypothetical protein ART_1410 [Arthrobacter sp. PAMC 25486]|nr:hypothetical protein ART_1410 [Arthrobacter sp. PAMC 25486]
MPSDAGAPGAIGNDYPLSQNTLEIWRGITASSDRPEAK